MAENEKTFFEKSGILIVLQNHVKICKRLKNQPKNPVDFENMLNTCITRKIARLRGVLQEIYSCNNPFLSAKE